MMILSKYLCNANTVGNWSGREQRVAVALNRIYRALDESLFRILVMGAEKDYHPDIYDAVMSRVWADWKHNPALLTLTDEALEKYIQACTIAYSMPLESGLHAASASKTSLNL